MVLTRRYFLGCCRCRHLHTRDKLVIPTSCLSPSQNSFIAGRSTRSPSAADHNPISSISAICSASPIPRPPTQSASATPSKKPVSKVYGGKGSADVWLRDHFAWEYKGNKKDLKAAYKQRCSRRRGRGGHRGEGA